MNTGDTITIKFQSAAVLRCVQDGHPNGASLLRRCGSHIPDREDAASLSETRLLLNTADSLLENRRNFGRRGLGLGGIGASLHGGSVGGGRCGISNLAEKNKLAEAAPGFARRQGPEPPGSSKKLEESIQ